MERQEKLLRFKSAAVKNFQEPATLDELAQFVIAAIREAGAPIVGFSWHIEYSNTVSVTHSCPVGEQMNWHQTDDKPKWYPGFTGRVWVRYASEAKRRFSFGSDPFRKTLTHTGTGGSGSYNGPWGSISRAAYRGRMDNDYSIPEPQCFSWDYRFYLQDWPLLEEWIGKERLVHVLANTTYTAPKHHFLWEDPDMLEQDAKYLNHYA